MLQKEMWQTLRRVPFDSVQGIFGNQKEEKMKVTGAVWVPVFLCKE